MLLQNQNKFDKDDVVSFKLVNGDEVVAKIVEENMTGYIINRPCTVIPSAQGIGLLQSMFTGKTDKDIMLGKQHVMLAAPTIDDIVRHYIKTTTGIEPVTRGSIIS